MYPQRKEIHGVAGPNRLRSLHEREGGYQTFHKTHMKREPLKRLSRSIRRIRHSIVRLYGWLRPYAGIPLCVLLVVCLILWLHLALPNLLGLSAQGPASAVLTAMAGILASILGIVVAILLVAFELLRRTYSHYGFSTIFRDRHLIRLIVLYSITIVVALFVAGRLSDPLTPTDASLCHLVFALFVAAIAILFPSCRNIIGETHSESRIRTLVGAIDLAAVRQIWVDPVEGPCEHVSEVARNPIYVLGQAVTRFIQDDDRVSAQVLIIRTTERLAELLEAATDKYNVSCPVGQKWREKGVGRTRGF